MKDCGAELGRFYGNVLTLINVCTRQKSKAAFDIWGTKINNFFSHNYTANTGKFVAFLTMYVLWVIPKTRP